MKQLLIAFFAMYCLLIAVLPCSDICSDDCHLQTNSSQVTSLHQQEDRGCSPFCQCSCCSTTVVVTYSPLFTFTQTVVVTPCVTFKQPILPGELHNIWQPPKKA